jgi:hypothetical protein
MPELSDLHLSVAHPTGMVDTLLSIRPLAIIRMA